MNIGASGTPTSPDLPAIDQALQPTWVRNGSAATQKAYALAQDFEQMLVGELSQSIAATSSAAGEGVAMGSEGAETGETPIAGANPIASELSSLLPQALSSSMDRAGGLGLAAQMTREMVPAETPSQVASTGGTER